MLFCVDERRKKTATATGINTSTEHEIYTHTPVHTKQKQGGTFIETSDTHLYINVCHTVVQ